MFFEKYPNIKRHENPSSGSLVVIRGRVDGRADRWQRGMTKLIVAFRNFVNPPNNRVPELNLLTFQATEQTLQEKLNEIRHNLLHKCWTD